MNTLFDKNMLQDVIKTKPIGSGAFGHVYNHPTNPDQVIKVPRSSPIHDINTQNKYLQSLTEKPIANPILPNRNFGQPVANIVSPSQYFPDQTYPTGIQILKKVPGKANFSLAWYANDPRKLMKQLNFLRKIPQESINTLRHGYKIITNAGGQVDAHPGNVMVNRQTGTLTPIDTGLEEASVKVHNNWKYRNQGGKDLDMWNSLTGAGSQQGAEAIIPKGRTLMGDMTPMRTEAMKRAIAQIAEKLRVAGTVVPAIAAPSQVLGAKNLYDNIKTMGPQAGYAKWLGLEPQREI